MESRECCSHCCDQSIVRKSDELREGCRSEHVVLKEPKTSSVKRHAPGCLRFRRASEEAKQKEIVSCYDKFALAKKLHAENLQHQPLPDRVDDSVFKNAHRSCSASCERDATCQNRVTSPTAREEDRLYGPALGYKKPKTRMDLAICWETPIDPVYEPRRATHIDGSEGGSAPAIFALIQHTPAPRNPEFLVRGDEKGRECHCAGHEEAKERDSRRSRCCCDCAEGRSELPRIEKSSRSNSVPRVTERKCAACRSKQEAELEKKERDPRLIRSAVGAALGLEKGRTTSAERRNGLPPAKMTVPRPRTPFARRTFCIDTLTPPFSVMSGCRDADYPEHWRLMSVYQQSYRNPQKRRTRR